MSNEFLSRDGGDTNCIEERQFPNGIEERQFPNGDVFVGCFSGEVPEGRGKYIWPDGCIYVGRWEKGKNTGKGKLLWPTGAVYEGDFAGGYMHGVGTYSSTNGSWYKGGWSMNVKHGFGHMRYINGDVYEGTWRHGIHEGPGKYVWTNKNIYEGEWKGGMMSGKGILSWANGDTFNGEWLNGLEHGHGVYFWADGSIYVGTWSKGLKDGKGVLYAAGTLPSGIFSRKKFLSPKGSSVNELLVMLNETDSSALRTLRKGRRKESSLLSSGSENLDKEVPKNVWLDRRWSLEGPLERIIGLDVLSKSSWLTGEPILEEESLSVDIPVPPILEREYAQGVLINEIVKQPLRNVLSKPTRRRRRQAKEPKRPGETIFKGHRSYDLMLSLQLGIRYTVGKMTPEPKCSILPLDFTSRASVRVKFPKMGSCRTPCHRTVDFTWKDYCPKVFRRLREMFNIDAADYMLSICGNSALRELSSPGKSGSVFFLSHDDRFMIKTMRKTEVKVLLTMLRSYYNHVSMHENTLITKFFGLHRVKPQGGQKVRFVVMGNMFCTDLRIHRRYDLKGSLQGRMTDKADIDENTTLKDLDLDFVFHLEPTWRDALMRQIACDCKFLESQHIMDYSLLLGLHFRAPQFSKNPADDDEWMPTRGLVLVPREQGQETSSLGLHVRGSPLKAAGVGDHGEVDLLLPGTARLQIQLGVNMPARADRKPVRSSRSARRLGLRNGEVGGDDDDEDMKEGEMDEEEEEESWRGVEEVEEVHDVVLYLGMIDILQEYDFTKKIEHAYKSLHFDPLSISAIEPKLYSKRFQDYISHIFPPNASS